MLVRNANSINWKPLELSYMHDPDISFKGDYEYFDEGFNFVLNDALVTTQDVAVNKYNNFYLTKSVNTPDIIQLIPKPVGFPEVYTTYLSFIEHTSNLQENTWYLSCRDHHGIVGDTRIIPSSGDHSNYFEVELVDEVYARVRHYNGKIVKYLSYIPDNRADFYFEPLTEGYSPQCDPQKFTYVFDHSSMTILLCKKVNNVAYGVVPSFTTDNTLHRLILEPLTSVLANPTEKVWNLRKQKLSPKSLKLQTTWTSYSSGIETNSLEVNKSRTLSNIDNNYLLMSYTNTLSAAWPKYLPDIEVCTPDNVGKLNVDILPLKNQLTVENKPSRGNVYDTEKEVNHRLYHGIHTGTNQEHGFDSIYLSYAAGVTELMLPANKLTYFHFPLVADPYVKLNINDSRLIDEGAISSNTPLRADKMFKKRSSDNNIEVFSDEKNGTWLCSWLSGSDRVGVRPIWVDRYYNPNYYTQFQALSAMNEYKTEYDTNLEMFGDTSGPFFDKISDLTFEPGVLYSYHHIGCVDYNNIVNDIESTALITKDADIYEDLDHVSCCPVTNTSDGDCSFSWLTYELDSDRYAVTKSPNRTGSFTVNFELEVDNWQKPFAHTILGNYDNDGFAIYNEESITPFIVTPNGSTVYIYNTDFDLLRQFDIIGADGKPKNIQFLIKKESTNSFWILDEDNIIHEYDMEGVERNRIYEHAIVSTKLLISDFEVDNDNNVYLLASPATKGIVLKLAPSLSGYDFSCEPIAIKDSPIASSAQCNQYGEFEPQIDPTTGNITSYEFLSSVTLFDDEKLRDITGKVYSIDGKVKVGVHTSNIPQGLCVDNNKEFWYVLDDILYHTPDPETIPGVPIALPKGSTTDSRNKIDAINCDKEGNIWILYTADNLHKAAKLQFRDDSNRASKLKFITDIPAPDFPDSLLKYIDFVYEFTKTGYKQYAIVFSKNNSGDTVIKIDLHTGKVIDTRDLDTSTRRMTVESVDARLPRYGIDPDIGTTTNLITGWDLLHTDTSLSAHDVWIKCDDSVVEEPNERSFLFNFIVNNSSNYTVEFYGDNKVQGYLDNTYMGEYDRSLKDTPGHVPVRHIKTLKAGTHNLRFNISNVKKEKWDANPLTLSFVLKDAAGKILLTSRDLKEENIVYLGKNPCANYYGPNEGLRAWRDVTGNTFYRNYVSPGKGRYMRVKLKAKNLYSGFLTKPQNSTFYLDWKLPEDLTTGKHYISVVYDANRGHVQLYVDTLLMREKDIGLGKYAFNELLLKPLFMGATGFFDNVPLFQFLKQRGNYLGNLNITDLRIYGKPLTYYDIMAHMSRLLKIRDMKWDLPSGQRNFIDSIDRTFKFKAPDRKSNSLNLHIMNSFVEDPTMQSGIEKVLREYIKHIAPLHTNINNIKWRTDSLGDSDSPIKSRI